MSINSKQQTAKSKQQTSKQQKQWDEESSTGKRLITANKNCVNPMQS